MSESSRSEATAATGSPKGPRVRRPRSFRSAYGAHPIHLLLIVATAAVAGWAVSRWLQAPTPVRLLVWFACALIGHDAVAAPVYSALDRLLVRVVGGVSADDGLEDELVWWRRAAVNHIRIPVLLSVLLLAMWYPLILSRSDATFFAASGRHLDRFTGNYLLVVAILFGGSLVLFMARLARAAGRSRSGASRPRSSSPAATPAPPEPGTNRP